MKVSDALAILAELDPDEPICMIHYTRADIEDLVQEAADEGETLAIPANVEERLADQQASFGGPRISGGGDHRQRIHRHSYRPDSAFCHLGCL